MYRRYSPLIAGLLFIAILSPLAPIAQAGNMLALNGGVNPSTDGGAWLADYDYENSVNIPLAAMTIYNPEDNDTLKFPIFHPSQLLEYIIFDGENDGLPTDYYTTDIGSLWNWDEVSGSTPAVVFFEVSSENSSSGLNYIASTSAYLEGSPISMPQCTLHKIPTPEVQSIGPSSITIAWPTMPDDTGIIAGYMVYASNDNVTFTALTDSTTSSINGSGAGSVLINNNINDGINQAHFTHNSPSYFPVYYKITPVLWGGYVPEVRSLGSKGLTTSDTLNIEATSLLPSTIDFGSTNAEALMLNLSSTDVDDGEITISEIKAGITGTIPAGVITAAHLVVDVNGDGRYTAGTDTLLSSTTPATSAIIFSGLSLQVDSGSPTSLLVLIDIVSGMSTLTGNTLGLYMGTPATVTLASADVVSIIPFPISTSISSITVDTVALSALAISPDWAPAGVATPVAILNFSLIVVQDGQSLIGSVTVTQTGTLSDSDISSIDIMEDTNGNGIMDELDTIMSSQSFSSASATFSDLNASVTVAEPISWYLIAYTSAGAPNGATLAVSIAVDGFKLATADVVSNSNLPFSSTSISIFTDTDGDGIPDDRNGDDANQAGDDTDDDNDGYSDEIEEAIGTDPKSATSTPPDADGDFVPDSIDVDDDNDGILDTDEVYYIGGIWLPYLILIIGIMVILLALILVRSGKNKKKDDEQDSDSKENVEDENPISNDAIGEEEEYVNANIENDIPNDQASINEEGSSISESDNFEPGETNSDNKEHLSNDTQEGELPPPPPPPMG